jgi:hypothetical protein
MKSPFSRPDLGDKGARILHANWQWAGRHLELWILLTIMVSGGAWALFDYIATDDRARLPALILLATLLILNAIWRATGALAARLEETYLKHRDEFSTTATRTQENGRQ